MFNSILYQGKPHDKNFILFSNINQIQYGEIIDIIRVVIEF